MAAASRFVEISQEFFGILLDNSVLEKTKKAKKYGMKIFNGNYFFLLDKTFLQIQDKSSFTFLDNCFQHIVTFYFRMVCKPKKI